MAHRRVIRVCQLGPRLLYWACLASKHGCCADAVRKRFPIQVVHLFSLAVGRRCLVCVLRMSMGAHSVCGCWCEHLHMLHGAVGVDAMALVLDGRDDDDDDDDAHAHAACCMLARVRGQPATFRSLAACARSV